MEEQKGTGVDNYPLCKLRKIKSFRFEVDMTGQKEDLDYAQIDGDNFNYKTLQVQHMEDRFLMTG